MHDANKWSVEKAHALLKLLNAPPRLLRHGEIVAEVAGRLNEAIASVGVIHDADLVVTAALLHDAGKIVRPAELIGPGEEHEATGEQMLLEHGVPPDIARCCRSHGAWETEGISLEELLVALADHIWKGTREERLELAIIDNVATQLGVCRWDVFVKLDSAFEAIASDGPSRLAMARV
jgi:putative nucleotidyltransferase with HDIG domain